MTPAAATAVTLLTAHPAQRWLLGIGGGLFAFGALLKVTGAPGASLASSVASFALLPVILFMGDLFQRLSALNTATLVPHYRRRLLVGVAVAVAVSLLVAVAVFASTPRGSQIAIGTLVAYAALLLTAFTLLSCLISAPGAMLVIGVGFALLLDAGIIAAWSSAGPIVTPASVAFVSSAAWVVFARWYLRGAPMPEPRSRFVHTRELSRANRNAAALGAAPMARNSVERNAERRAGEFTLIFGMPLSSSVRMNLAIAAALGLFFLAVLWLTRIDGIGVLRQLAIVPVVSLVFSMRAQAKTLGRRLWLLDGSRTALFRLTDAAFWRLSPIWAGTLLVICVGMVSQGSLSWEMAVLTPLLFFGHGTIALYVILTPSGAFKVAGGIALGVSCLLVVIALSLSEPRLTASVVIALQLMAVLLLRALAERRWRTIDWTGARVPGTGRQRLRNEHPATPVTTSTE